MLKLIQKLNIVDIKEKEIILKNITDDNIKRLYFEIVDFKDKYSLAYDRVLEELTHREVSNLK